MTRKGLELEGDYEEIINIIGQWKIIDIPTLHKMISLKLQLPNLLYKVRQLEKNGYVKGMWLGRNRKHVFLTNKGIKLTPYDYTYEICDENLTHDLVTGRVLRELLTFTNFKNGRMFHQISEEGVFPDAMVEAIREGKSYNMAIEVELTQKASNRVKEKYIRYTTDRRFNFCLFVTNKPQLYRAYQLYLQELSSDVQEQIVLLLDKNLSPKSFNFLESECFYQKKSQKFVELFGDRII
ncbi:MAG: hypothetical protein A2451_11745 [Bdellovibrionales bacterium RIFOXYC2_FULL_39_8]|nr:MAG: hypothetical protein A2385_14735 [Bdellovibrionales bacterium RIFOXYB1_FULL_39_21]OFZ43767.1 MAG: hypothetical protein A2485_04185 [Bdellovibrionales bacterium RIFOXYC12_FULL_39_17]OFZ47673.1 MAG: hypothetical protein A2404_09700 [Bdellovibrionales bacterium RIFOXYC1_FULL_39_130]OFZ69402.1 MAG: hypothetical protein A2451_11745 [Bdellovibrionales bacterium RIFOXYC2_FULL_39_8]OFZ76439.1 MAG: hypothetical protein A2560_17710 [Bdellovibrionales bacterium RIFOXYD1_FULL_39_84]